MDQNGYSATGLTFLITKILQNQKQTGYFYLVCFALYALTARIYLLDTRQVICYNYKNIDQGDELMGRIIKETQDLTYLTWSIIRHSSGTAGSFLKAQSELDGKKLYYKLSNYDTVNGITGHESVNEIIADRLLDMIGFEHLEYTLIHADIKLDNKIINTYVCMSENFRNRNEDKVALDAFYEMEKQIGETPLEFCIRMGWEKTIYEMLVTDHLILNRDRHGANIEVLRDKKKRTVRLAPLFDNGLSLLFSARDDAAVESYDISDEKPVQSFVGGSSTRDNLMLIPADKLPCISAFKESDKAVLFEGLDDIISNKLMDKIWAMIWERRCQYEALCDKRR